MAFGHWRVVILLVKKPPHLVPSNLYLKYFAEIFKILSYAFHITVIFSMCLQITWRYLDAEKVAKDLVVCVLIYFTQLETKSVGIMFHFTIVSRSTIFNPIWISFWATWRWVCPLRKEWSRNFICWETFQEEELSDICQYKVRTVHMNPLWASERQVESIITH